MYAYAAKQDGKVISVDSDHIKLEYQDGSATVVELGEVYGTVAGTSVKHTLVSDLSQGDTFAKGDVISYNTGFFERDFFNPKQVSWKAGVMAKVVVMESSDTLEDSSAVTQALGEKLSTPVTEIRPILVKFDQAIHNLVSVGDEIDSDAILCTIEDAVSAGSTVFDESTVESLRLLAANSPKAKVKGTVERIEVVYNGDKSDMSESLTRIANSADRRRSQRAKRLENGESSNGRILESTHIDGKLVEFDHALIRVFITTDKPAGIGDKAVFGNALKTVIGRVMTGRNETQDGTPIDAIFAYQSISNRIVLSPEIAGTTNTLLRVISQQAVEKYRNG